MTASTGAASPGGASPGGASPGGSPGAFLGAAGRSRASARTSVSVPLRGSMPPTDSTSGPAGATCWRSRRTRRGSAAANRSTATPFPARAAWTPYSAARICCHIRLTTSTWSGSRIAWRWQSISFSVSKSSTWWTVRTTIGPAQAPAPAPAPASRIRAAARAEMQSWACSTGNRAATSASATSRASMLASTLASRPACGGGAGAGTISVGAATGRKNPWAGSPSPTISTG